MPRGTSSSPHQRYSLSSALHHRLPHAAVAAALNLSCLLGWTLCSTTRHPGRACGGNQELGRYIPGTCCHRRICVSSLPSGIGASRCPWLPMVQARCATLLGKLLCDTMVPSNEATPLVLSNEAQHQSWLRPHTERDLGSGE